MVSANRAVAGLLGAGLALTVAACGITPLGPDASPRPVHLRSPIVLRAMRVQLPSLAGRCPAEIGRAHV